METKLIDRGGGLLYDPVLDITWLQDANYAKTSGASATGQMSWADAVAWLDTLVYHDTVRGRDITGWRLPAVKPIGADYNHQFRMDGTSDEGYNIRSPKAEMSYMYYVNLGLTGWWTVDGKRPRRFGVLGSWTAMWSGEADVGPVKHLQSYGYWCGSPKLPFPSPAVWVFTTSEGNQRDGMPRPNSRFVWPVHDGDVAANA
ncbi:MAG: hypothetical protein HZC28_13940 [Spirochaetes bacterium]|nr:hypothetical protein [Spirochaetota bacterium]